MNKLKLIFKSIAYSWNLIFESSKLLTFLYFALSLITTSFPLLSAFLLKYILDALTAETPDVAKILSVVIIYGLAIVLNQGFSTAQSFTRDTIHEKAKFLYRCRMIEKLSDLPMDVVDSSAGKDMVDDMRYIEYTALNLFFRVIGIASHIYTFSVAFATLSGFSLGFAILLLVFTIPGNIFDAYFDDKMDKFRQEKAPDLRKFHYYRWMLTDAWPAKDVRMYDLTDAIKARYDTERNEYVKANKAISKKGTLGKMGIELFMRSGEIAFIIYVIYKAVSGTIGIGDVALYIGFMGSVTSSFVSITWLITNGLWGISNRMVRLFEFFGILPKLENGLDSYMTRSFSDTGTELSKGQWQKVALARAYFKNAPIIIFDEPSAALDAEAEDRIFKNFEAISDGKTGIMISHRIHRLMEIFIPRMQARLCVMPVANQTKYFQFQIASRT